MNAVFKPERLRISIEQYQKMGETGVLEPGVRCELIAGELLTVAPIGSRHAETTRRLRKRFERAGGDAEIAVADPVDLGADSQPQPDLMLLMPRPGGYANAHPQSADVLLLIEVSDSSLEYDRSHKRDLYAKYGISEYWVVDVTSSRIVVYLDPWQGAFRRTLPYAVGDTVWPQALPLVAISVGELFA